MEREWETETLVGLLERTAASFGARTAVVDRLERMTYAELLDASKRIAGFFFAHSIEKGDRVIVQMPNSVMFEVVCFALFSLGALPVFILPMHREHVIEALCEASQPKAYVTSQDSLDRECYAIGARMLERCGSLERLFTDVQLRNELSSGRVVECDIEAAKPGDVAFLSLSGGTTGIPKLIGRTNGAYSYNALITARHCRMDADSVMLTAIPAAHNFALGTPGMIGTVLVGGKNVMCEYPSPLEIFDWIGREQVTIASFVPTVSSLCVRYRSIDASDDIGSLQYFLVGGSVFSPVQAREAEAAFEARLVQVYGMAEGMTFLTDLDAPDDVRYGSQGRPRSPEDVFRIVDEDFADVEDGVEGEVIVKGPYTIKRYFGDVPANESSFRDGFYRPGDKGLRLPSGDIRITGRVHEQINRAGEKIMPSEVEDVLMGMDAVSECAVVGVADEVLGTAICAFYIGERDIELVEAAAYMRSRHMEDCCIPDQLQRLDSWPLTAVGKIDREGLKEAAVHGGK